MTAAPAAPVRRWRIGAEHASGAEWLDDFTGTHRAAYHAANRMAGVAGPGWRAVVRVAP